MVELCRAGIAASQGSPRAGKAGGESSRTGSCAAGSPGVAAGLGLPGRPGDRRPRARRVKRALHARIATGSERRPEEPMSSPDGRAMDRAWTESGRLAQQLLVGRLEPRSLVL